LVPADRRLYALRDATGTVPSIPLIASSIMSKKLAEGLDALVLDVKVGRGAFMKDLPAARELAETLVGIGTGRGTTTAAVLTDMSQPLGREVGNANELAEALDVLGGQGPDDLLEVTYRLGERMLLMAGVATEPSEARERLRQAIETGAAFEKLAEVVEAQGGDPGVLADPRQLPRAPHEHVIAADRSGYVVRCDALDIGVAAMRLGAGRETKEDSIDPGVGITVCVELGNAVDAGQPMAALRYAEEPRLLRALTLLEGAFSVEAEPAETPPLIYEEVR
jgi:pyrimidine-nucleoside phosphorylase